MRMHAWGAAIVAACLMIGTTGHAEGGNTAAARRLVVSSLQVSGNITIAPDGSVQAHTLDPGTPLGEPLTRYLDETIAKWRFEPVVVDGKTVTAKVPMHLRLLAKPRGDGNTSISIASTYFGSSANSVATDQPRSAMLKPPMYPADAQSMGGQGTVYLIVQVGPDGSVINVAAEQVNLRVLGTARQLDMLRKSFTLAAERAGRQWTFLTPTTGDSVREKAWLVRVPVDFRLTEMGRKPAEGTGWDTYIPGPINASMPWAQEGLRTAAKPDALPDNGVYPLKQGATLLSAPAS